MNKYDKLIYENNNQKNIIKKLNDNFEKLKKAKNQSLKEIQILTLNIDRLKEKNKQLINNNNLLKNKEKENEEIIILFNNFKNEKINNHLDSSKLESDLNETLQKNNKLLKIVDELNNKINEE